MIESNDYTQPSEAAALVAEALKQEPVLLLAAGNEPVLNQEIKHWQVRLVWSARIDEHGNQVWLQPQLGYRALCGHENFKAFGQEFCLN